MRVPPEHVFGRGLADLFVVRLAGDIPGETAIGSLECALEHLGTSLELGHQACAPFKAGPGLGGHAEGNLSSVLDPTASAVAAAKANGRLGHEGGDQINAAIHQNARLSAKALVERSPLLRPMVAEGKLLHRHRGPRPRHGKVDLDTK